MMGIYGANLESRTCELSVVLQPQWAAEAGRHVPDRFNLITASVMLPMMFVIERFGHVPLIEHLVQAISSTLATRLALVQISFNIVGAALMMTLLPTMLRFLAHRFRRCPTRTMANPPISTSRRRRSPDSALDLARLEQRRLASYSPRLPRHHPQEREGQHGARLDRQNPQLHHARHHSARLPDRAARGAVRCGGL